MKSSDKKTSFKYKYQATLHEIIFEADTAAGKFFDVLLIISITASVLVVMLDSIRSINEEYGTLLYYLEWFFTILFTIEYILRLLSVKRPMKYALSFLGIIDLLAIIPTYLSIIVPASRYLIVIRVLRVLRIFRVLKLVQYVDEARIIYMALQASRHKITVFLFTVLTLVVILGSMMYLIEGEVSGFTSIPMSIYWAIVTLTTVGYGDISPITPFGQALAALIMIMGYSILAVPTGIVTVEFSKLQGRTFTTQACPDCSAEGHDHDARFCKYCGEKL